MIPRTDKTARAVLVIILAVLALSLGDALIKFTSGEFGLWQVLFLRSVLVVPVLLILTALTAPLAWAVMPIELGWTVLRSLMLVAMWILYYLALPILDLSVAAAGYYTLPILITVFSAILIGDRISIFGWLAVCIGFLGVLLILRPNAGDFNGYAVLPLGAAVLYALSMILTRTKCRDVHPMILALGMNLGFLVVGGLGLAVSLLLPTRGRLDTWAAMGAPEWGAIGLLAIAILIGGLGAAYAYQNGAPKIIGTFDFAYVGFAVLWGVVFFDEVPELISIMGIAMIVIAGVLSLRQ